MRKSCNHNNNKKMKEFSKVAAALLLLMVLGDTTNRLCAQQYKTFTVNGVQFAMKHVNSTKYALLGRQKNNPDHMTYNKDASDETVFHIVSLDAYYIGETEVTQALWKAVVGGDYSFSQNPSKFEGDDLPVHNVSWDECQRFIQKLNDLTGQKFRLPTEAEWENAATVLPDRDYATRFKGDNLDDYGWYWRNSGDKYLNGAPNGNPVEHYKTMEANNCRPHPVKTKTPNDWGGGLYDMCGNVPEWCQDRYDYLNPAKYYISLIERNKAGETVHNPQGPDHTEGREYRVVRGGGWNSSEESCRVWAHGALPADMGAGVAGFRLALSE